MRVAPLAEVRHRFSKFIEASRTEPVFITRNGKIAAVLEAISDADVEDFLLERNARFRKVLEAAARRRGGLALETYRARRKA